MNTEVSLKMGLSTARARFSTLMEYQAMTGNGTITKLMALEFL
jgi:hypothetical protein